jgi:FkbH-like protein
VGYTFFAATADHPPRAFQICKSANLMMSMKLAEALKIVQSVPPEAPALPVALLCGFTPLHLETFLRAELCNLFPSRSPQTHTGLFDDLVGNIERVTGVSAAVVVIEWPDLDPRLGLRRTGGWEPSQLQDILRQANRGCELLQKSITTAARNFPVVVCFPTLPLPPVAFTPLARASEFTLELRSRVALLSAALSHIPGVRIVDPQRLDALSSSRRLDVNSDLSAGFPYTLAYASALAQVLAELVLNRQPKKGLITDLDDTLWRGILGEVGVQGVSWDLDHHSQIHALYQQLLHSLAASGTLIAVASKNDHALVAEAFAAREPILRASDVFPFEVHWRAKSQSVTRILSAWNISADDIVCVDDSPMDLAEIKAAHPGAECLLFPRDNPQAAYESLERLRDLFGKDKISEEDGLRAASLRANAELQHERNTSSPETAEDFVRHIEGKLTLSSQKEPFDSRALELVNKTNQFNLNGRRFEEAEWKNWLSTPDSVLVTVSYRDKYGPLGKIVVIAGELLKVSTSNGGSSRKRKLSIRTWVMSCRAFSRLIEYECLRWLFTTLDVEELEFDFLPTVRNTPMQNFLQRALNAPAQPHCRLSRAQFMQNCPASIHSIVESTAESTKAELTKEEFTKEELTNG